MTITGVNATLVGQQRISAAQATGPTTTDPGTASSSAITTRLADTVQISGESLVLARLFRGHPVTYTPGDSSLASGTIYGFLTTDDRTALASMYEYAQAQGADLAEVDHIAFDLGIYRSTPPTIRSTTPATLYDQDGTLIPIAFTTQDEAVATRILTSKAVKDSALPEAFLRYELTPATGMRKAASFTFLEQYTYATSPTGADGASDSDVVLAPRSPEYFRELQVAAGTVYTPEQLHRLAAGQPTDPVRPGNDAHDTDHATGLTAALSQSRTDLAATLYDTLLDNQRDTGQHRRPIDELAYELLATRTQHASPHHD